MAQWVVGDCCNSQSVDIKILFPGVNMSKNPVDASDLLLSPNDSQAYLPSLSNHWSKSNR